MDCSQKNRNRVRDQHPISSGASLCGWNAGAEGGGEVFGGRNSPLPSGRGWNKGLGGGRFARGAGARGDLDRAAGSDRSGHAGAVGCAAGLSGRPSLVFSERFCRGGTDFRGYNGLVWDGTSFGQDAMESEFRRSRKNSALLA